MSDIEYTDDQYSSLYPCMTARALPGQARGAAVLQLVVLSGKAHSRHNQNVLADPAQPVGAASAAGELLQAHQRKPARSRVLLIRIHR